jgi:hypothetical protein
MRRSDSVKRWIAILGLLVMGSVCVPAATIYVSPEGGNQSPFATMESAAWVLQDAADLAKPGDEILVGPGVYTNGGKVVTGTLTNRVTVPQGVTLRGIEGAAETVIRGVRGHSTNSVRCVYLERGARLIGVTVEHGGTRGDLQGFYRSQSGGGILCEEHVEISDCVIISCTAYNYGGGVFGGTLTNCVIAGNWSLRGGGAAFSELNGCIVLGNQVSHIAGGVYRSQMRGCTVENNISGYGAGGVYETDAERSIILNNTSVWIYPNHRWGDISYSCLDPIPDRGISNITSRVQADRLGYGSPSALLDAIPDTAKTNAPAARRGRRTDKRKKAMGIIEPVPGDAR